LAFGGKLGDFGGWRAGAAKGRGPFDENRGKARPGTLFASALGLQPPLLYGAAPLRAPVLAEGRRLPLCLRVSSLEKSPLWRPAPAQGKKKRESGGGIW